MSLVNFQMPEGIVLDEVNHSTTFGRFIVQPLEKGFGVTIGNAFRRVLLSSLPGYAITAIRIEGIVHEFSTLPGLVEDVSDMILNLKEVRLKATNKKVGKVMVHLKGPGKFKAGDIQKASAEVEILNPDHHIATLNKDADFEIELRIGRGKGYVTSGREQIAGPNARRHCNRLDLYANQKCALFCRTDPRRPADGLRKIDFGD